MVNEAHSCTLEFIEKFGETFGKDKIDQMMNGWLKAVSAMSDEQKSVMANEIVESLVNKGVATDDMSLAIDFRNQFYNNFKYQKQITLQDRRANWSRADHIASVKSIATNIYDLKGAADISDIMELSKRLRTVDVDDIQNALSSSKNADEFVTNLAANSPEMARMLSEKTNGYHRGTIEMLERFEQNVGASQAAAVNRLETTVRETADMEATFFSHEQMKGVVSDLFEGQKEGKFTSELGTGLYNNVMKPLVAEANNVGHFIRNPINSFFNMSVADSGLVATKSKEDFVSFIRKLIKKDANEAVREMGIPMRLEKFAEMDSEEVLLSRIGEIYDKLLEGDQYAHTGVHVDSSNTDVFNQAAKAELNPSWNASGGISPLMVVPWKDADAFLTYMDEFSNNTLSDAILSKTMWLGRNVGITEIMGTHPEASFKQLLERGKAKALQANDKRSHALLEGKIIDSAKQGSYKLDFDNDLVAKEATLKQSMQKAQRKFYVDGDDTALLEVEAQYRELIDEQVGRIETELQVKKDAILATTDEGAKAKLRTDIEGLKKRLGEHAKITDKASLLVRNSLTLARDFYSGNPDHYFQNIIGKAASPLDSSMGALQGMFTSVGTAMFLTKSLFNSMADMAIRGSILSRFNQGSGAGLRGQMLGKTLSGVLFGSDGVLASMSTVLTEIVPDLGALIHARATGKRAPRISGLTTKNWFGFDKAARKQAAMLYPIFSDMMHMSRNRLHGLDDGVGTFGSKIIDTSIQGVGLQALDSTGRQMTAMVLSRFFAVAAETPWAKIDAEMGVGTRKMFKDYDITQADLAKLKPFLQDVEGQKRLIGGDLMKNADRQTYMKFLRMMYDIDTKATPTPSAKQKAAINQGERPGTYKGGILKFVGWFKSFSLTMNQEIVPYMNRNNVAGPGYYGHLSATAVEAMVWAAAAGYLRDIAFRQEQEEITSEYFVDLFLKTGLAGMYGDLLLKEYDHYNTLSKSLAGPGISLIDRVPALVQGDKKVTSRQLKQLLPVLTGSPTVTTIVAGQTIDELVDMMMDNQ